MPDATYPALPRTAPLYKEVKRHLVEAIAGGEWKPGEAIPAERRLSERYGISIGTVRKAIDQLCAENILIRQQGRGTYVARHNRDRVLFYFFHVVPERGPKSYPGVELLSFTRTRADRSLAEPLGLAPGDPLLRIRNRLSLEGTPIMIDDIALAAARFPGLTERAFRNRPSTIYNLYQDSFGISVVRTQERLRAASAGADMAALLAVARGAPLLQIRRVAYGYQDDAVEYRVSHLNTAHHEYYAEIGS
jgi:GntR family transcriptional regulator